MNPDYDKFLTEQVLQVFYEKRQEGLQKLHLQSVLKRKNPYLFKAKNLETAGDLVKNLVDSFLSFQNELTREFIDKFMDSDRIDWVKFVDYVSKKS
jgi:site-specific DNA-methyltransferase (cytosine-N4-specific)